MVLDLSADACRGRPAGLWAITSQLPLYRGPRRRLLLLLLIMTVDAGGAVMRLAGCRSFIMADRMLQIERVQISDEGVYVCRVENSVGWREAEARLVVHCKRVFTSHDLGPDLQNILRFIVRSTYDSDLNSAKISFRNIVS